MKTRVAATPHAAPTVRVRTFDVRLVICASKSTDWGDRPLAGRSDRDALIPERFQSPSAYGSARPSPQANAQVACEIGRSLRKVARPLSPCDPRDAARWGERRPLAIRAVPWNEVSGRTQGLTSEWRR